MKWANIKPALSGRVTIAKKPLELDAHKSDSKADFCALYLIPLFKILKMFNSPCPAELFQLYFSSFEAEIANAISSFK